MAEDSPQRIQKDQVNLDIWSTTQVTEPQVNIIRRAILLRGLSGAGKSRFASILLERYLREDGCVGCIFSADQYHVRDGIYKFDPKRLDAGHVDCFGRYDEFLLRYNKDSRSVVAIVDNTNIRAYEMSPYIQLAKLRGWSHEIITIPCDPLVAFKRNQHRTPFGVIMNHWQLLQSEQLPPHFIQVPYLEEESIG